MKYLAAAILMVLAFSAYMSVSIQEAYAFGTSRPFGGFLTITTPGVTCEDGSGPFQMNPATSADGSSAVNSLSNASNSALPYFFPYAQTSGGSSQSSGIGGGPSMGQWVLGWYDQVPDTGDCYEDEDPYTVYKVTMFGHSTGFGGLGSALSK